MANSGRGRAQHRQRAGARCERRAPQYPIDEAERGGGTDGLASTQQSLEGMRTGPQRCVQNGGDGGGDQQRRRDLEQQAPEPAPRMPQIHELRREKNDRHVLGQKGEQLRDHRGDRPARSAGRQCGHHEQHHDRIVVSLAGELGQNQGIPQVGQGAHSCLDGDTCPRKIQMQNAVPRLAAAATDFRRISAIATWVPHSFMTATSIWVQTMP